MEGDITTIDTAKATKTTIVLKTADNYAKLGFNLDSSTCAGGETFEITQFVVSSEADLSTPTNTSPTTMLEVLPVEFWTDLQTAVIPGWDISTLLYNLDENGNLIAMPTVHLHTVMKKTVNTVVSYVYLIWELTFDISSLSDSTGRTCDASFEYFPVNVYTNVKKANVEYIYEGCDPITLKKGGMLKNH